MCNFQEMFLKAEHVLLCSFLHPADQNVNVMAGPQAATLEHEMETKC